MLFSKPNNEFYQVINNTPYQFISAGRWMLINKLPDNLIELSTVEALTELQKSTYKLNVPIGVIGTGHPTDEQYLLAKNLGLTLGNLGFIVLCGGRGGIMRAVCEGVHLASGISIGILPNLDINEANEFVSIPIATGIGFARNSIIAAASFCLISFGGSNGTLTEISFGLQYNKRVMALTSDFNINGLIHLTNISEVIQEIYAIIFNNDCI